MNVYPLNHKGYTYGIALSVVIVLLLFANLIFGSVDIPFSEVLRILSGETSEKASWNFIIWESRFPQSITALLCGAELTSRNAGYPSDGNRIGRARHRPFSSVWWRILSF